MLVNINKLNELVDLKNVSSETLKSAFANLGYEIEQIYDFSLINTNLVGGKIIEIEKIPNTKLTSCTVDVLDKTLTIVCGDSSVNLNQHVIVALPGARLYNNISIEAKTMFNTFRSEGMICSLKELGLSNLREGIFILEEERIGWVGNTNPLKELGLHGENFLISLPTNRNDANSYYVIALEIANYLGVDLKIKINLEPMSATTSFNCPEEVDIYTLTKIELNANSKIFLHNQLKTFLTLHNVEIKNNFLLDLTNAIKIETGVFLNCYAENSILLQDLQLEKVEFKNVPSTFSNLGNEINKKQEIIYSKSRTNNLNILGVNKEEKFLVNSDDLVFWIESYILDWKYVKNALGFFNQHNKNINNLTKPLNVFHAYFATSVLISKLKEFNLLYKSSYIYCQSKKQNLLEIEISKDFINQKIGTPINFDSLSSLLTNLQYQVYVTADGYKLVTPPYRNDLFTKDDVLEEIIRFHNLNLIPKTALSIQLKKYPVDFIEKVKKVGSDILAIRHFREVKTYSLVKKDYNQKQFNFWKNYENIQVTNPASLNREYWKVSNILNILETVEYNLSRSDNPVHIFEFSRAYEKNGEPVHLLTIATHSVIEKNIQTGLDKRAHITALSEELRLFFNYLGIKKVVTVPTSYKEEFMHPYLQAEFKINDQVIAKGFHIGKCEALPFKANKIANVLICEVNLSLLSRLDLNFTTHYKPVSNFPSVERQFNFLYRKEIDARTIKDLVKNFIIKQHPDLNLEFEFYDVYRKDENLNSKNLYSLSFKIKFRFLNKTAKEEEINHLQNQIIELIENKLQATLRLNA